jgi:hypothetical protein
MSYTYNVHAVNYVRQTEIYTSEPIASEHSAFYFDVAILKFQRYTSPRTEEVTAKLIKQEV